MRKVQTIAACKSYRVTLDKFEELVIQFDKSLSKDRLCERSVSSIKSKLFEILGETVKVSISPIAAEYIIGKVEFNLIVDPLSPSLVKRELLQLYLNSRGEFGFELDSNNHFVYSSELQEESDVELYITNVVLKNLLGIFDVETYLVTP
jgi:hypothetical protein